MTNCVIWNDSNFTIFPISFPRFCFSLVVITDSLIWCTVTKFVIVFHLRFILFLYHISHVCYLHVHVPFFIACPDRNQKKEIRHGWNQTLNQCRLVSMHELLKRALVWQVEEEVVAWWNTWSRILAHSARSIDSRHFRETSLVIHCSLRLSVKQFRMAVVLDWPSTLLTRIIILVLKRCSNEYPIF